ncbi:hypothetical protein ESA94_20520 [Lacibacter luteus]|uniref:Uncharacterized protein n=1 Tax=Lacibacter luteus TaxID=2508719 RepID=A0A4Q1CDE3_9BACT|nr:hypothetical protein [Lacibacter luteus]RXK57586.1 hypothetical protein ESA94_20520 [Lacibacter luteus]
MSSRHVKQFMQFIDYFPKQALPGIVLIVVFLSMTIYTLYKNGWHISGLSFGAACAFVFTLGWFIWMIQHTPADLSDNNRKQLSRAEYEYWMKKDPTFDTYWLEKWERNELTGITNPNAKK